MRAIQHALLVADDAALPYRHLRHWIGSLHSRIPGEDLAALRLWTTRERDRVDASAALDIWMLGSVEAIFKGQKRLASR